MIWLLFWDESQCPACFSQWLRNVWHSQRVPLRSCFSDGVPPRFSTSASELASTNFHWKCAWYTDALYALFLFPMRWIFLICWQIFLPLPSLSPSCPQPKIVSIHTSNFHVYGLLSIPLIPNIVGENLSIKYGNIACTICHCPPPRNNFFFPLLWKIPSDQYKLNESFGNVT